MVKYGQVNTPGQVQPIFMESEIEQRRSRLEALQAKERERSEEQARERRRQMDEDRSSVDARRLEQERAAGTAAPGGGMKSKGARFADDNEADNKRGASVPAADQGERVPAHLHSLDPERNPNSPKAKKHIAFGDGNTFIEEEHENKAPKHVGFGDNPGKSIGSFKEDARATPGTRAYDEEQQYHASLKVDHGAMEKEVKKKDTQFEFKKFNMDDIPDNEDDDLSKNMETMSDARQRQQRDTAAAQREGAVKFGDVEEHYKDEVIKDQYSSMKGDWENAHEDADTTKDHHHEGTRVRR